jgi:hypothetical protein
MQVALQHTSLYGRLQVWWLLSNLTLAPPNDQDCWQLKGVKSPTHIYGSVHNFMQANAARNLLADPSRSDAGDWGRRALAAESGGAVDKARVSVFNMHSLGFSYLQGAFVLPPDAQDRFMELANITLHQLPQGPAARAAVSGGMMPADVWTLLLWPINRFAHAACQGEPVQLMYVISQLAPAILLGFIGWQGGVVPLTAVSDT